MQYINGASVPTRTGQQSRDLEDLRTYLYKAMEELRFRLEALERELSETKAKLEKLPWADGEQS